MIKINAAQVQWLVKNKPETEHYYNNDICNSKLYCNEFSELDLPFNNWDCYYLTQNTYNELPEAFKTLNGC